MQLLTVNRYYFGLAILIFIIEVLIAIYVHDDFIRPYLGDVLVVILLYCFLKSFVRLRILIASALVLAFAFTIEWLQFLNVVEELGLQESKLARTVIGTSFSWLDMLAYVLGILVVLLLEKLWLKKS